MPNVQQELQYFSLCVRIIFGYLENKARISMRAHRKLAWRWREDSYSNSSCFRDAYGREFWFLCAHSRPPGTRIREERPYLRGEQPLDPGQLPAERTGVRLEFSLHF